MRALCLISSNSLLFFLSAKNCLTHLARNTIKISLLDKNFAKVTSVRPHRSIFTSSIYMGVGDEIKISGLAKALGKFRIMQEEKSDQGFEIQPSFLSLLRNSEFVQMGDPRGNVLVGKIFQVVNTDLYIDFGGKFYCVCRKPKRNPEMYVRHATVRIRINELELCARFLGASEDLTLTEASGTLLGLVWTPLDKKQSIIT